VSVLHRDRIPGEFSTDLAGADIELNEVRLLDVGQELQGRRCQKVRAPRMRDEADVVVFDQMSDAPGGRQTATAREIGLNDVHFAPFDQVTKSPVGRLL